MANPRALRAGKAVIELSLLTEGVEKGLKKLEAKIRQVGQRMARVGTTMLKVGGAIAGAFIPAIKAASDFEEALSKFTVVFGEQSEAVREWAKTFGKEIGRSQTQLLSFMASSQDLFVPLGFEPGAATAMSKQITTLAIDLASFNTALGITDEEALANLQSALTGSGQVMKKYGVILNDASIKQELLNMKIDPSIATNQQKVMARLNIIMANTTAAHGDAIRTAGSFAGQMKRLKAELSDAAVTLGQVVLPTVTRFINQLTPLVGRIGEWVSENRLLVAELGRFGVVLVAVGGSLTILGHVIKAVAVSVGVLKVALLTLVTNPVIAAVTGLGLAIGVVTKRIIEQNLAATELRKTLRDLTPPGSPDLMNAAQLEGEIASMKSGLEDFQRQREESRRRGTRIAGADQTEMQAENRIKALEELLAKRRQEEAASAIPESAVDRSKQWLELTRKEREQINRDSQDAVRKRIELEKQHRDYLNAERRGISERNDWRLTVANRLEQERREHDEWLKNRMQGVDSTAGRQQALFDVRLSSQAFGPNKLDRDQLNELKKIAKNTGRSPYFGLPVTA